MTEILDASRTNPTRGGASFAFSHRLTRLVWNAIWFVAASWTPPALRAWRRALLRLFGAKIDRTANIYGSARIWCPRNLTMEAHACIGPSVNVYNMAQITFGSYALASQGAHLCGGTHDIDDPNFQLLAKPIHLGARSWVAAEAFVGPGVTLAEGAVLGARAVAFRDLEAWTVYSGNPAQSRRARRQDGGPA